MPYAIKSEKYGTFVGMGMGLVFFTGTAQEEGDTLGQPDAATCSTPAEAEELIRFLIEETRGIGADASVYSQDDLSFVEVKSGHWKHLQEAGLEIGDMDKNELEYMPVAGMA